MNAEKTKFRYMRGQKRMDIIGSYLYSDATDAKSTVNKLNNGHVVQKDYFLVCIAFRFPHVRQCPNLITI